MKILKDFEGFLFGLTPIARGGKASYHDVVEDAPGGKGLYDLEGAGQALLAQIPRFLIVDLFSVKIYLTRRGSMYPSDAIESCGLTCAVGTNQAQDLTLIDGEG
jgi:hypothetical protein